MPELTSNPRPRPHVQTDHSIIINHSSRAVGGGSVHSAAGASAVGRGVRPAVTIGVLALLLLAVLLGRRYGPAGTGLVVGPAIAMALVAVARHSGMSWLDLGLARRTWARGAAFAGGALAVVAGVYAVAAMLPVARPAFLDVRYELAPGRALLTALVFIPLGTVLVEEIAFRGVLFGLIKRHRGTGWGLGLSSALFGIWHVIPALSVAHANAAMGAVAGTAGQLGVVVGTVGFTAVAGLLLGELRRRSGSLFAAAGLHWAVNGLAVLVTAVLTAQAAR